MIICYKAAIIIKRLILVVSFSILSGLPCFIVLAFAADATKFNLEIPDKIRNVRNASFVQQQVSNNLIVSSLKLKTKSIRYESQKTGEPSLNKDTENYSNNSQPIKEIRVAAAANWSPYAGRDKKGNGIGPAYDLIVKIAEPLGIKIIIEKERPWKRYVQEIKDGLLDIILTAYRVDPFGEYSEHYAIDEVKVFVKPGKEFPFHNIKDLSAKIGIQPQGAGYDITFSQRVPGTKYTMRENSDAKKCIEMVLNGDGDYYVSAYYDVLAKLKASGYEGKLIDLKNPVYIEKVVMIVSKKSPIITLLPEINNKIKKFRDDGTVKKSIDEYINRK